MKLLNGEWSIPLSFFIHLAVYSTILATLLIFVALIVKYLEKLEILQIEEATSTETDHLIAANSPNLPKYGTYDQEDVESGNGTKNYSDESTDGKICIICYDEERNCFFVPCGHSATCQSCAQRIVDGESKRCPICRRLIRSVKKTFSPYKSKLGWLRTKVLGSLDGKSKSKSNDES